MFPSALGIVKRFEYKWGEIDSKKNGSYIVSHATGLIFDNVNIYNPVLKGDENHFGVFLRLLP